MELLDGQAAAAELQKDLAVDIACTTGLLGRPPKIAIVLVGSNPASKVYVANKRTTCAKLGIETLLVRFEEDISEEKICATIHKLNEESSVDGIIVQLPLPDHINEQHLIESILPEKDIDGFHPLNLGRMQRGQKCILPATPHGILLLMNYYDIATAGKDCVVVGRSLIVGSPISILLAQPFSGGNATVTLTHSKTIDLKNHLKRADIVIAALGRPQFITADMIKPGAVVIDVGINKIQGTTKPRLVGDVDFKNVAPLCSWITPVPGGVGPMTILALVKNTLQAIKIKKGIQ